MAKVDLSDYNVSELIGLEAEIEIEIKARQQQEVATAREQILAIAKGLGISVEELLMSGAAKSKGDGKKVQAAVREYSEAQLQYEIYDQASSTQLSTARAAASE